MEKLETVKSLVRANNYKNNDVTYKQCLEMGVSVNRVGLEIFARKLRAMDRAEEIEAHKNQSMQSSHSSPLQSERMMDFEKSSIEYGSGIQLSSDEGNVGFGKVTNIASIETRRQMPGYSPTERKKEITFELGTIKVREYELLQELNMLIAEEKQNDNKQAVTF